MPDCGQHCPAADRIGNTCTLKPHAGNVHVWGTRLCVSGHTVRYVDQATADMYPPCGFGGIMTADEIAQALAEMDREADAVLDRMAQRRRHRTA